MSDKHEAASIYNKYGLFIDGTWRWPAAGRTYVTINPATEEPIAEAPEAGSEDVAAAIDSAARGFAVWRRTQSWERARIIRRIAVLISERMEDLARIITIEVGKPLAQSRRELQLSADQFEWYAEETKRLYGETLESRVPGGQISVAYEPVGVVAAFTAWNFPAILLARKIAPAIAAGCSIICRPSIETPGAAMGLVACCHDAGLPPGVVNLLTGPAEMITQPLLASPKVRKISLTGSTAVGKKLLRAAADTVKRVTMELGGHAPVIVCDDVDAEKIAELSVPVKFAHAGQVCVAPSRFYVHESKERSFTRRFAEVAKALKIGNGLDPATQLGPLTTKQRRDQVESLVESIIGEGGEVVTGGRRPPEFKRGFFYEPTVFRNVLDKARIMNEEPFGPIAPITTFTDFEDVINRANALEYGLASYVFTKSLKRAHEASSLLESGMVGVNTYALAAAEAPFGGVKHSGMGREGGRIGIRDYLDVKYTQMVLV